MMIPSKSPWRSRASTGMHHVAALLLALAVSGTAATCGPPTAMQIDMAHGMVPDRFADSAALRLAVQNCLAKNSSGFECCSRADHADCGAAYGTDMPWWDVSLVTDMEQMFQGAAAFDQNIGCWNVSAVVNMYGMFQDATAFNHDISGWDTRAVTSMQQMFKGATAFNQDITGWNMAAWSASSDSSTQSSTKMNHMFVDTTAFLAAYTNCGHVGSYDPSVCSARTNYAIAYGPHRGPPTAWQINEPPLHPSPPPPSPPPLVRSFGCVSIIHKSPILHS